MTQSKKSKIYMNSEEYRSIGKSVVFTALSLGLYSFLWISKLRASLNKRGASITSTWHLIVPIYQIIWIWRFFRAAEKVSRGEVSAVLAFFLGLGGLALTQEWLNKELEKASS